MSCVSYQVVVKTKADYDGESKKGKLRSPKIAEFSISIIEGVSERLKVRIMSLPSSACFIYHPISNISSHTYTCVRRRADSGLSAAQDIRHSHRNIPPPSPPPNHVILFFAQATFISCVLCSLVFLSGLLRETECTMIHLTPP